MSVGAATAAGAVVAIATGAVVATIIGAIVVTLAGDGDGDNDSSPFVDFFFFFFDFFPFFPFFFFDLTKGVGAREVLLGVTVVLLFMGGVVAESS